MYVVGSHILSAYAPRDYISFVGDRVFEPLGMKSSTFSPVEANHSGRLTQSWTAHSQRIPYWIPEEAVETIAGPGGVISSVEDLVSQWLRSPQVSELLISCVLIFSQNGYKCF